VSSAVEPLAAAEIQLPDGARYDRERPAKVLRFAERYCRHSKGRWRGQPVSLNEHWQRDVISHAYGVVDPDGNRWFSEVLVGIARKNGKSTMAAALALHALVVEGTSEGGMEVYSAAADKDQAKIVFGEARRMVMSSPKLLRHVKPYRDALEVPSTGAVYKALSSEAGTKHGLNPAIVIIDELHAHKDAELYNTLTTGTDAREQPLTIVITTAGHDESSICYERYEHGTDGLDPRFLFRWYGPTDPEFEVTDFDAWCAANPSSWMQSREKHAARVAKMKRQEAALRRLHFNTWTKSEKLWLPTGALGTCRVKGTHVPEGVEAMVAIDSAPKRDTTVVALVAQLEDGRLPAEAEVFKARASTGVVDWGAIREHVRALARNYDLLEVRFDPYNFRESAAELEAEGIPMVEFPQNDTRMVPATTALYDAIVERRLEHDFDAEVVKQLAAAATKSTSYGGRLHKIKSTRPIDAAVALAMAVDYFADGEAATPGLTLLGA
jgi:phage terminase large subunit-like protein